MGGQHQVAHDQAPVVHPVGPVLLRQNDQNGGRAVEGVESLLPAPDLAVQGGDLVPQFLVGHGHDNGRLVPHPVGGIQTGLDDLLQVLLRGHVRLEPPDAAPLLHGANDLVHDRLSL